MLNGKIVIWNACCMVNVFVCNYADIRRAKAISEGQSLKWVVPDIGTMLAFLTSNVAAYEGGG